MERSYGAPVELVRVEEPELQEATRRFFAAPESVVQLVRDLAIR